VVRKEEKMGRRWHFCLTELNEKLNLRKFKEFNEIELGNYHALSRGIFTQ